MDRPRLGPTPTMAAIPLVEVELAMLRIFSKSFGQRDKNQIRTEEAATAIVL